LSAASAARSRRVLVSAYACEPGKGSEPGAGWLWALAAARTSEVWVLTRANNRTAIESDPAASSPSLHFVYLDLPPSLTRWKRPGRAIRLYYAIWQLLALRAARQLHARVGFDVVHHVTFANVWLPALSCAVDAPFVLGPVSGGQRVARAHYRALGAAGTAKELALRAARPFARANPVVRMAWRRAALILLNNLETRDALPRAVREKTLLRPGQCVDGLEPTRPTTTNGAPIAIYAGRLHRFKGLELALRALALRPEWRLLLVGSGPDERRLRRLAHDLHVEERVEFRGQLPQPELWREVAACDAFLLPSLKEGGGFAALEAAVLGLPVVAFDAGGPAAVARCFPEAGFELVPPAAAAAGLAAALARLGTRSGRSPALASGLDALADDLEWIYAGVADGRRAPEPARLELVSEVADG
jgi:glycosyltransferase involved in cell wall biosynthesis